ncbi:MAG: DUF3810 family protein, partial [Acidobacteriaceae bacterium]|nr:DUF3810 family protein [Acidobacteriaceae bacterium]
MGIAVIWTVRVALWGLAIAAALLPMRAEFVERHFSHGVFPRIQTFLTAISNRVPFALFDVLLVLVVLWWLGALVVDIRRGRGLKRGYGYGYGRQQAHWGVRLVVRTVTLAAVAYLAFLVTWGLNYRRVPLRTAVAFDEARVSPS